MFFLIFLLSLLMVVTAIPIENNNGKGITIFISTNEFNPENMTYSGKYSNKCTSKRDDYNYTSGIGYYKLHSNGAKFNDARKICIEEGGHLAVINSFAEERVLLDIFAKTKFDQDQAYVGIHNLYSSEDWVTIFDDSLPKAGYSEWIAADVQTYYGYEGRDKNCGTLYKTGKLNNVYCTSTRPFFCEIPEF